MTLLPNFDPTRSIDHEPVAETDIPNLSPDQKAEMMEQGFLSFAVGGRQSFSCYFMLEDPHHTETLQLFAKKLGIEPYDYTQTVTTDIEMVLANTDVALLRQYHTYENGMPYDVSYVGVRSEPTLGPSAEA